jgi:hypothetical protein
MLDAARRQGGRGTLRQHRQLWRYCVVAFRDWHGGHLVSTDQPIITVQPLSKKELVDLLQLAEELPALIRDLMKLHSQSRIDRRQVVLKTLQWSDDRRQMLIDLHRFALFAAGVELDKAKRSFEKASADFNRGNYAESCAQRQKMVTACERQIATLEDQLGTVLAAKS